MQKEFSTKAPQVSVTVVTYNHGNWLELCLESIVKQRTDFVFEVIVGDDASTDGKTIEILRAYSERYPEIIVPVYREKNIGPTANYLDIVKRARGEYIAHVDGDDGMFQDKLQFQKDFMDLNKDCVMSGHQMRVVDKSGCQKGTFSKKSRLKFDINYLLANHALFAHSSIMYRSFCRDSFVFSNSEILDIYLYLVIASKGKVAYLPQELGYYRTGVGIASKNWPAALQEGVFELAYKLGVDSQCVEKYIAKTKLSEAYFAYKEGDYRRYFESSLLSLKQRIYHIDQFLFLIHSLLINCLKLIKI